MLLGNETVAPTNASDYFDAAKAAPQTTGGSLANGLTAGFITPIAAVNDLKNYFSVGATQSNGARDLLDSIHQDQERPDSSTAGYLIGDMAGFLLNPINLVGGAAGSAAGKLIGGVATKFLPEATNLAARTVGETGGAFVGSMVPTDIVENYNADTNHLSYGGLAEDMAINLGIGMALPAVPYAYGLIKNRVIAGRETKSTIQAANSALVAKDITEAEHAFYTAYARKEDAGTLEGMAQNIVRESGQEIDSATGKVPVAMLKPNDAKAIQDVMGDQLANDLPHELKGAVSDYIVNSRLDALKSNPKLIDGLKGFVGHVDQKLATRTEKSAQLDRILDKNIGRELKADAPLSQKVLYQLAKEGKQGALTVPARVERLIKQENTLKQLKQSVKKAYKELQEKEPYGNSERVTQLKKMIGAKNDAITEIEGSFEKLLHPKDELHELRGQLITEKGLLPDHHLTKPYHRLLDVEKSWLNARAVHDRVKLEHGYEKQASFKQLAENLIKLSESNTGKLADESRVTDYLKGRLDSKIFKRNADPIPEAALTDKPPAEGEVNIREELDSATAKHGNIELVQEAKEAANQYDAFKKAGKILDAYIECENKGVVNA